MPFFAYFGSCTRILYLHILENQRVCKHFLVSKKVVMITNASTISRMRKKIENVYTTNFEILKMYRVSPKGRVYILLSILNFSLVCPFKARNRRTYIRIQLSVEVNSRFKKIQNKNKNSEVTLAYSVDSSCKCQLVVPMVPVPWG